MSSTENNIKVEFFDYVEDSYIKFAVILARHNGRFVFCKHRQRSTLEIPGGHRETDETVDETAIRELQEETGAREFEIRPLFYYGVICGEERSYGRLYLADISKFYDKIDSEMEKIYILDHLPPLDKWTYPIIQYELLSEAQKRKFINL